MKVALTLTQAAADIECLASLLDYNPETGALTWREYPSIRADRAHPRKDGVAYRFVSFEGETYRAHIIAFFIAHGRLPANCIDHIDGDGTNNALENLRDVTQAENLKNKKLYQKNQTGVPGVIPRPGGKKWRAQIGVNGRPKFLGEFPSVDEAIEARRAAEVQYGYHANHGRIAPQDQKKNFPANVTQLRLYHPKKRAVDPIAPLNLADAVSWYELAVWPSRRYATVFGNPIKLTKVEFRILCTLISAQGLEVARPTLWECVYGTPFNPASRTLDMNLSRLRAKLEGSNTRIHVLRGTGFRLESIAPALASLTIGKFNPRTFNFGREAGK